MDARRNPISLSIVRIKRIEDNRIYISGIDALDGTPLLDIKPYSVSLDAKADATTDGSAIVQGLRIGSHCTSAIMEFPVLHN